MCVSVCVYLFKFVRGVPLWARHLNMIIIIIFVIFALIISPQVPSMSKPMYMGAHMCLYTPVSVGCVPVGVCVCVCMQIHLSS